MSICAATAPTKVFASFFKKKAFPRNDRSGAAPDVGGEAGERKGFTRGGGGEVRRET
jgi:hypothetical protein